MRSQKGNHFFTRARDNTSRVVAFIAAGLLAALPLLALGAPARLAQPAQPDSQDIGKDLQDKDAAKRQAAAERLALRKGKAGAGVLRRAALAERNVQVRAHLLRALAVQDGDAAVPALSAALASDPAVVVRVMAAQELGRLALSTAATQALSTALAGDKDAFVRKACAVSLGFHADAEAIKALDRASQDADPRLRESAALGLSRQPKGRDADRALDRLERDKDKAVAAKTKGWRRR
jgi:HEAT repeat protein